MELRGKAVQVDSPDDELMVRAAAIDVARDTGMVCTRTLELGRLYRRGPRPVKWCLKITTSSVLVSS